MMNVLILLFLMISVASLVLGLIRPVLVLWFLDRFNRVKVIKVYGIPSAVFLIVWMLIECLD